MLIMDEGAAPEELEHQISRAARKDESDYSGDSIRNAFENKLDELLYRRVFVDNFASPLTTSSKTSISLQMEAGKVLGYKA